MKLITDNGSRVVDTETMLHSEGKKCIDWESIRINCFLDNNNV